MKAGTLLKIEAESTDVLNAGLLNAIGSHESGREVGGGAVLAGRDPRCDSDGPRAIGPPARQAFRDRRPRHLGRGEGDRRGAARGALDRPSGSRSS